MLRKIVLFLIISICFVLQTTTFQSLSIASIAPNLLIIVVSSFGLMRGKTEGMYIGFFSGLLIDIFCGFYLGIYALLYMYVGYLTGLFQKRFYPEDIKLPLLIISVSDLLTNIINDNFINSLGCKLKGPTLNQLLDPFLIEPTPGINTNKSKIKQINNNIFVFL